MSHAAVTEANEILLKKMKKYMESTPDGKNILRQINRSLGICYYCEHIVAECKCELCENCERNSHDCDCFTPFRNAIIIAHSIIPIPTIIFVRDAHEAFTQLCEALRVDREECESRIADHCIFWKCQSGGIIVCVGITTFQNGELELPTYVNEIHIDMELYDIPHVDFSPPVDMPYTSYLIISRCKRISWTTRIEFNDEDDIPGDSVESDAKVILYNRFGRPCGISALHLNMRAPQGKLIPCIHLK